MSGRVLWPTRAEAAGALASAVLFAVAFPPFPLVAPALTCLVPLSIAVAREADRGPAASVLSGTRIGFWFGLVGYGANLYWIASALAIYTNLAFAGYAAAVLTLAIVLSAVVSVLFVLRRDTGWPLAILVPLCWVAGEFALGHLSDLAFPWLPLALATTSRPVLAQLADAGGVHAVSLWIGAVNGLLADAWLLRARRRPVVIRLSAVAAILALAVAYGAWRMAHVELLPVGRVAIVQPNVPQAEKWQERNQPRIVGMLAATTREALHAEARPGAAADAAPPQLVLWPEAPLPDFLFRHPPWRDTIAALAHGSRTPLLAGILDWSRSADGSPLYYNGAMLVEADGRVHQPIYDKRRLVPIVERVPFLEPRWFESVPWFGGFSAGSHAVVFRSPAGRFGTLICYESIFPELSREYRQRGAQFLVNVTNDAWFGRSLAPHQHLAHLVLRAIENRVGVVRAANTGFSGYIDPLGRVRATTPLFVTAAAAFDVETTSTRTLYDVLGDWVGWTCLLAVMADLAYCLLQDRTADQIADRDRGPAQS